MQKKTKFSIIFITAFLIFIATAFVIANKWTKDFQQLLETQGSVEHAKVHDVVITETKDSVKSWEIYSAEAEYDANNITATLQDIIGNYYQNGEVVMSFSASNGSYNSQTKEISLWGAIKIVGKDDAEMSCDRMNWITTSDKINAKGNVVIEKGNEMVATSTKASVRTDFKKIEISENTELRLYREHK